MPSITLSISDLKYDEYKEAILKVVPIPTDDEGPTYTENEWMKEWIVQMVKERYKQGREELAKEAATIDNNIIS